MAPELVRLELKRSVVVIVIVILFIPYERLT